jgi:hypothetical protein
MLMHCGGLLLLLPLTLPTPFPLIFKLAIGLLVLGSAWYTTRRHLLLIDHPLEACVLHCEPKWHWIALKSGQIAKIGLGSFSHPQLIVLKATYLEKGHFFGIERQSQALIIFPDALDMQTYRQLRVAIRYANNPPEEIEHFFKKN